MTTILRATPPMPPPPPSGVTPGQDVRAIAIQCAATLYGGRGESGGDRMYEVADEIARYIRTGKPRSS